ncbi:hypothetical protein [Mucilaginibacter sp. OK283]|jgi:hypothetical protein|uniref:hypothetical protein n=1 Tax=Mucilaginibacter sp. OK283 TaxID=1881049 RepID=UPI0008D315AA|nr:hypothetical protein [Mucilaginibacter sp. OK283]SEP45492.1 hypothetical protein SAMN05428947_12248 [Mucilaginibacter sp. OK283]
MKNSIKLSALFLLLSAGIFTSAAANAKGHTEKAKDVITVSSLKHDRGVAVMISKNEASKSYVTIFDQANNILMEDFLPSKVEVEKGYVLTNLDNGDYKFEIKSNDQMVTKTVHVYDEDNKKRFFFID